MYKILLLLLLISISAFAGTIRGKVTCSDTNKPVENVNVYLANTMMGSVTDVHGNYEFYVKPGEYSIVVSHIAYKPLIQKVNISLDDQTMNLEIQEQTISFDEVSVSAKKDENFQRQLKIFNRCFIGTSFNADECFIENPQYLNFIETALNLIATCDVPLIIFNKALGYDIKVVLQEFHWSKNDVGGNYSTFSHFIDLSDSVDAKQREKWLKARIETYKGSPRHFFKQLYDDEYTYDFQFRLGSSRRGYLTPWTRNGVYFAMKPADKPDEKILYFEQDMMKVEDNDFRTSEVKISDSLRINKHGNLINFENAILAGYWGELRMADTLPFDYEPSLK